MTTCIILALSFSLAAWDLFMLANDSSGDTISEVVWDASKSWPMIPFSAGFLAGHLFWNRR